MSLCQISEQFSGDAVEGEDGDIRQAEAIEGDIGWSDEQASASIEEELSRLDDIMEEQAAAHEDIGADFLSIFVLNILKIFFNIAIFP